MKLAVFHYSKLQNLGKSILVYQCCRSTDRIFRCPFLNGSDYRFIMFLVDYFYYMISAYRCFYRVICYRCLYAHELPLSYFPFLSTTMFWKRTRHYSPCLKLHLEILQPFWSKICSNSRETAVWIYIRFHLK